MGSYGCKFSIFRIDNLTSPTKDGALTWFVCPCPNNHGKNPLVTTTEVRALSHLHLYTLHWHIAGSTCGHTVAIVTAMPNNWFHHAMAAYWPDILQALFSFSGKGQPGGQHYLLYVNSISMKSIGLLSWKHLVHVSANKVKGLQVRKKKKLCW